MFSHFFPLSRRVYAQSDLSASSNRQPLPAAGLISLVAVYVIWSSTYLAIRIAVREDSGFPAFMMAGSRILISGALLFLMAAVLRTRLRVTRSELGVLAASGLLLWVGGNGMVTWAEQRANSGYAALLVGSMPIWVAAMEAILDRRPPSVSLLAALFIGFIGVALLAAPGLTGTPGDIATTIALVIAPLSFGAGSILQKRSPVTVGTVASAAYQNVTGGAALLLLAVLTAEHFPNPTLEATAAWAYLIVFGSLVGFTAFVNVLRLLPMNIAATYAYVNPVGAVLLGWLVLGESITLLTIAGALLVLLGVTGVFREQLRTPPTLAASGP
jgi:drug/metabolite transporter (DMT)-like permease